MPDHKKIYVPPGGPPQYRPNPEIYQKMGEENIFQMLEDFYAILEGSEIRHLFPANMRESSKKSGAFFVFLLGGPPLYQQQHGSPMMRQRHIHFTIDETARQVWLRCFHEVLKDAETKYKFPKEHMEGFCQFLDDFSAWMVNTKD